MKESIREHWLLFSVGIVIIFTSILVQALKETPCPEYMPWYQCWSNQVFKYFADWAFILGATGTLLLAFIAFWTIKENRRSGYAKEVRIWAENALRLLLEPVEINKTIEQNFIEFKNNIRKIHSEFLTVSVSAIRLSEKVDKRADSIRKKLETINNIEYDPKNPTQSLDAALELLAPLGKDLGWLMIETS